MSSSVAVDSREDVVQQYDRGVGVDGASEGNSSSLPAAERDAALADQRSVACWQNRDVGEQRAGFQSS